MNNIKYKAYIRSLGWTVPVELIDFKYKYVAVDLSDGQGDTSEYNFDEVELYRSVGLTDKNGKDMYENDTVKYTKIRYTDCSREEIEEAYEPLIGKLYFAEGIWLGIQFDDGTGSVFMAGTIDSNDFEMLND